MPNEKNSRSLRGEDLFREQPLVAGVFVPKLDENKYSWNTFAAAVKKRSQDVDLNLWPSSQSIEILQDKGVAQVDEHFVRRFRSVSPGIVLKIPSIGYYPAYFVDEKARDRAIDLLDRDYEFVPNFSLSLPTPILDNERDEGPVKFSKTYAKWSDETGIVKAHESGLRGQGVLVGVLDTGIDADHAEFKKAIVRFAHVPFDPKRQGVREVRGFDTNGHGSHVCGILAGERTGVAKRCELHVASVIESETLSTSFVRVVHGLGWLLQLFASKEHRKRPAIINLSLGLPPVPPPGMAETHFHQAEKNLRRLIDELVRANILVVAAIGNDGEGNYRLPANYPNVLGVGAVDSQHSVAEFSGGSKRPHSDDVPCKPDLAGFGVDVYSPFHRTVTGESRYDWLSGTSMAAPYVAGIAALYWCHNPALKPQQVIETLKECALIRRDQPKHRIGAGLAQFSLKA